MADYSIPYGNTTLTIALPDDRDVTVIAPRPAPLAGDVAALVRAALAAPLGGFDLAQFAGTRRVAIAISDKTRPIPQATIRPLLEQLAALGIPDSAITLLIATGTHIPMRPDEFSKVLPEDLLRRYRVLSHDCDDPALLVPLGTTPLGTPVTANRHFVEADLRLVIGNIEPHQFAGFSGGVKSAAIGLTGRETINTNHAMLRDPRAEIARYDDNPLRQDMEAIGQMLGVHAALNAVLNREKSIVHVLVGEPVAVMRAGIPLVRELFEIAVPAPLDLAITAPGGHPKDINLYQAQKAIAHAARVTRTGGRVILVAACPDGTGSRAYEEWVIGMPSHAAVMDRFAQDPFRLGPHKAFQIARDALRVRLQLVSEMDPAFVRTLLLDPAPSAQAAVDAALAELPPDARIGILPSANATIPVLKPREP